MGFLDKRIENPHAVARLAKIPSETVSVRKPGTRKPVVLSPIAWGKPDKELAGYVRESMDKANPGTFIPWAPGQGGLRRRLRSMHVHTDIDDQPIAHVHRFVSVEELK